MLKGGMPPPPGVTPNFENPEKMVWTASIVTQALCISIVGAIVALRLYVRIHIIRMFQLEDWLICAGYLMAVGYSIIALVMNHYGGGMNMWEVPKEKLTPFGIVRWVIPSSRRTVYCTMIIYGPCAFCIKASILLVIARIFAPIPRAVLSAYIILGALLAYYLPVLFLKSVICQPVERFWHPTVDGKCFDKRALILADAFISVISDTIIVAVPLPLVFKHVQKRKRVKIAMVFSIGGLACICTVIRLIDIVKNGKTQNQTLVFMRVNLWGIAEVYIGLIAACMPFLPAFWKHHFGKNDATGYTRQSEGTGGIEMLSSNSRGGGGKRSVTVSAQKQQGCCCGSDENILMDSPPLGPMSTASPKRTSFEQNSQTEMLPAAPPPAFTSCRDALHITKTVQIEQSYAQVSEASLDSRVDGTVFP
ncbi:hypothetical protein DM02DRAFT_537692 [Periconia macrospinosa]|uniref:Rhodopsin domain-containing protein n=1 Tax=Periconia macrospinosa TaxID=97972 RepID=A0A2V1DB15_9PLEO|nr:hypothetical protein DM02DRAFT_537692 [Periconia macrospinosa]